MRSDSLLVLAMVACGCATLARGASPAATRCELPEPTVLRREGNSVLQVWELPAAAVWFGKTVPDAPGYLAYRAAIRAAGGDRARPVADPLKVYFAASDLIFPPKHFYGLEEVAVVVLSENLGQFNTRE